jgi:hypothetical protein
MIEENRGLMQGQFPIAQPNLKAFIGDRAKIRAEWEGSSRSFWKAVHLDILQGQKIELGGGIVVLLVACYMLRSPG